MSRKHVKEHNLKASPDIQAVIRQSGADWTVLILALMMFMAPALGVPSEEMLQDTLKSIIISWSALLALFVFFWIGREQENTISWHPVNWLPVGLALYALGSMTWSHSYLGGVEAGRWFIFSLLVWLGGNSFNPTTMPRLAWGIHLGVTVASIWTALQFWFDFKYFPQGADPASTFVNRNFFAEYAVCALPLSFYLLTSESRTRWIAALTISIAFNIAAIMMSGTRSALVGTLLLMGILLVILLRFGNCMEASKWSLNTRFLVPVSMLLIAIGFGLFPTQNEQLIASFGGGNAIDRAISRTISLTKPTEYTEGSFSIRSVMWLATGRMIEANPVMGVGAGAWEVQAPLYQTSGSQLETDFYAHNEVLQLLAEYGLVGWVFLIGLVSYLSLTALRTWNSKSPHSRREAPLRALSLSSLFVLFVVSSAGFPWRLAATGALFAICLGILAASDLRLYAGKQGLRSFVISLAPRISGFGVAISSCLLCLAVYVSYQSMDAERKLVRGIKLALTVSKSGQPNNPYWDVAKADLIQLMKEGIAINPHYRKLTPMAADELASWGDWENAVWIWESVLTSRPNVVAIAANISRGYLQMGNYDKSLAFYERAAKLQPTAPAVRSLHVLLLAQTQKYAEAAVAAKVAFDAGVTDYDLVFAAYKIGVNSHDWPLAKQALEIRIKKWPNEAHDGWLKLGDIYNHAEHKNVVKALKSYREAVKSVPDSQREALIAKIPAEYRVKVSDTGGWLPQN